MHKIRVNYLKLDNFSNVAYQMTKVARRRYAYLSSFDESVKFHEQLHLANQENKYFRTSDKETNKIVKEIISKKAENKFLENVIMQKPNIADSDECGSILVKMSDIRDFPEAMNIYQRDIKKNAMICVGGPAAEDQALMAASIPQIKNKLDKIVFITRNYNESNTNHSAKQLHARHANALNADPTLTGHRLLPTFLKRLFVKESLDKIREPNYVKVDLKFDLWNLYKFKIYLGNEWNWLKQSVTKLIGKQTEHDMNRIDARISQEILKCIESYCNIKISHFESGKSINFLDYPDCAYIFANFDEKSDAECRHENEDLKRAEIPFKELSKTQIGNFFPNGHSNIFSAYSYETDSHLDFDTHRIIQRAAIQRNVEWKEDDEVSNILLTNDCNNPKFCGVLLNSGRYIYGNKLHMTAGYKTRYIYDKLSTHRYSSESNLRNILNRVYDSLGIFSGPKGFNQTTTTACSINAVFKKSEKLQNIIDKYGSLGELAIVNSNWTQIAESDSHVLVRITAGGNTGSEKYKPSYFINVVENTKRIYGDDFIGVYSAYGCPRALNSKNSTQYTMIAKDAMITFGKGGTGNTKRHYEAAKVLMDLGFKEEIVDFFNQVNKNDLLGNKILNSKINRNMFSNNDTSRTTKRMGY